LTQRTGTRAALTLGIVGGLVLVAIGVLIAGGIGRPQPTLVATLAPSPGESSSATSSATAASPTAPAQSTGASSTLEPAVEVLAAGDISTCTSSGDTATARIVLGTPGTVLTLGDNVYENGTRREFADCYDPTWGQVLDRTRPAPGNHDYHTAGAAGYFGYFGERAGDPKLGYYAFDLGAWRIYSLNSNCADIGGCDARSKEVAWLQADLAANRTQCVLAYWHHPRYRSGPHGNNAAVGALWTTLATAGAELVLNGHDHDYERFAPQSASGTVDPSAGLVEFVVGTGGNNHYQFGAIEPNSRAHDNTSFGVLQVTLAPGSWTSRFVPVAGRTYSDSASGTCH
jgi:Calcineurin-like phosphoesterase